MGCTVSGLIASIPFTSSTEQRSAADQNLDFKIVQFLISGGKILSYSAPRKYNFSGNFSLKNSRSEHTCFYCRWRNVFAYVSNTGWWSLKSIKRCQQHIKQFLRTFCWEQDIPNLFTIQSCCMVILLNWSWRIS